MPDKGPLNGCVCVHFLQLCLSNRVHSLIDYRVQYVPVMGALDNNLEKYSLVEIS